MPSFLYFFFIFNIQGLGFGSALHFQAHCYTYLTLICIHNNESAILNRHYMCVVSYSANLKHCYILDFEIFNAHFIKLTIYTCSNVYTLSTRCTLSKQEPMKLDILTLPAFRKATIERLV